MQDILDKATEGVIYFSMGSNAKSKDFPSETKKTLLDAFEELPYTVLWKYEEDELHGKPDNVVIAKWLPQQDVLSKYCSVQNVSFSIYCGAFRLLLLQIGSTLFR